MRTPVSAETLGEAVVYLSIIFCFFFRELKVEVLLFRSECEWCESLLEVKFRIFFCLILFSLDGSESNKLLIFFINCDNYLALSVPEDIARRLYSDFKFLKSRPIFAVFIISGSSYCDFFVVVGAFIY